MESKGVSGGTERHKVAKGAKVDTKSVQDMIDLRPSGVVKVRGSINL
jgi:hypothetical protein